MPLVHFGLHFCELLHLEQVAYWHVAVLGHDEAASHGTCACVVSLPFELLRGFKFKFRFHIFNLLTNFRGCSEVKVDYIFYRR